VCVWERVRSAKAESEKESSREGAHVQVIIVFFAEGHDLEHVLVLGLDLIEVLVVFSAVVDQSEGERRISAELIGETRGRRQGSRCVGLFEAVVVDFLDLDELW